MVRIESAPAGTPARAEAEAYVAAHCDPCDDLLVWADVGPPLAALSAVWLAREAEAVVGVAFAFPLWPERPALGVHARTAAQADALLQGLVAAGAVPHGFVICADDQAPLFARHGQALAGQREHHMLRAAAGWERPETPGVRRAEFAEVDSFLRAQGAGAWHPAQFETGPYVVAVADGVIVAAAGTHFRTPGLAQLGNVFTAPAARGQGWARRCTAAAVTALFEAGVTTVSLFVATDNLAAVRVYEGLGFQTHRTLAAFPWDAGVRARAPHPP